jgi:hypothetical protein
MSYRLVFFWLDRWGGFGGFLRGFGRDGVLCVVILWTDCGGLCGECGRWIVRFLGITFLQILEIFLWKFGIGIVKSNGKSKSEIQGSFDSALRALAQDDDGIGEQLQLHNGRY